MALLIKHDSLGAALGSGTALVESALTINYDSEQGSAAEAPPVVETAARQIALSRNTRDARFQQQADVRFVLPLPQNMAF